ncbi:MAG: thioredoxin-dependent thiol peroxidase [Prolixibacteraceae bacterium]
MTWLKKGDKAPDFKGFNQRGELTSLSDFRGQKLILYFYPKDNTPACTAESCNLNDHYREWLRQGYRVVGVSPDSVGSHQKFAAQYRLAFDLIADPDHEIMDAYGVWGEKSMYGRKFMGVIRTTFVIGETGIIEGIIGKVRTKDHSKQILKALDLKTWQTTSKIA